ncbi:MAG: divergent polysaccharide deacetylase family protein [Treponema sp.]|jgi:polysaccharide deacetylase 2 family uncharacterized protein YibQ|nr:divergent polysaccharide deacetylase family protein [Treponema sp.]
MKKQVKTVKKTGARGKTAQNTVKKEIKPAKKLVKSRNSDIKRAFFLAGSLAILSASISVALILIHSLMKERAQLENPVIKIETVEPETPQNPAEKHAPSASVNPDVSVSVQPPAEENITTPAGKNALPVQPRASVNFQKPPERLPDKPVEISGSIAFVIDDAGNNLRDLEPFLRIPVPLTIAVLPGLPHSQETARRIRAAGKEVFLHQPMEALAEQDPGPGAIYSGMNADEVRKVLKRNIDEIGPVTGINNHQGSKITSDWEAVETILAFCAENNLLFLDSRTTAETVVPDAARRMGIQIAERGVFIDNDRSKDAMAMSITGGLSRAKRNGQVIMIGHAFSRELAPLLAEQYQALINQGFVIKTVSDIIR